MRIMAKNEQSCAEIMMQMTIVCSKMRAKMHVLYHKFCTSFCTENARRNDDRNVQPIAVCILVFARHSARVLPQNVTTNNE